jgi:hypothetical protein
MMAWGGGVPRLQHLQDGDAESCRLARTRLGLADDIVAVEGGGDELGLDGTGGEISDSPQGIEHGWAQAQILESGMIPRSLNQTDLLQNIADRELTEHAEISQLINSVHEESYPRIATQSK